MPPADREAPASLADMLARQTQAIEGLRERVAQIDERLRGEARVLAAERDAARDEADKRGHEVARLQAELDAHRRRSLRSRFSPKLGVLYQHPPRPMEIPARYRERPAPAAWPRISIVIATRNQGDFIERTLASLFDQDYPSLELLVQDGGSDDQTLSILTAHRARLAHFESGPDGGQAQALNRGFHHANGDVLAYLNSDDLLLPGALHHVGKCFAENPDIDVVYGHRVVIDEDGNEIGRWVLPAHDADALTWADYIPQETLFWRRGIWENVGGRIDESYCFAMDWDLLLRFQERGARLARLPRFLGAFRIHRRSKTAAEMAGTGQREMDRLRERCHGRKVSQVEALRRVRGYLFRHLVLHKLWRLGLVRY